LTADTTLMPGSRKSAKPRGGNVAAATARKPAPQKSVAKKQGVSKRKTAALAPLAAAPVEQTVRPARGDFAKAMLLRFVDADLLSQAAALAFYAVLSLAPLLLLLLWLVHGLVPAAQDALLGQVSLLAGDDARHVATSILESAKAPRAGSIAGGWSLLLLFIGASAVFAQLQDVLNRIFRTDASQLPSVMEWLRKRIFSLGLVFAVGFLLIVSLSVTSALELAFGRFDQAMPVVMLLATALVYTLSFALMYHFMPDRRVAWRLAVAGGAVTSVLLVLGRAGIGWYLDTANPTAAFGSMATLAIALLWVYYASLIVFLGALLTAVIDERRARAVAR
jgi:membrane protein